MPSRVPWTTGGLVLALALAPLACHDDPAGSPLDESTTSGTETTQDDTGLQPSGPPLPPRPASQTCHFDGWAPGLLPPLAFEPSPVPAVPAARVLAAGLDGVVLVGTDEGRIVGLDPGDTTEPLRELLPADGDRITGLAVGEAMGTDMLYVRSELAAPARSVVNRYALSDARALDPDSGLEVIAIDHDDPQSRRGEGLLVTEGLLWIPLGDDGDDDYAGPADDPDQRPGNLLRLDVSTLAFPHGYTLPPDNPLLDLGGAAAEAWAWGLRDPAGCTYDTARERLWCSDAGASISEVSLVARASNLGWPRLEGSECQTFGGCDNLDTQPPQASYHHAQDDCGVGPAAYANGMDAELDGALVYGDRCSGKLLAARPPEPDRRSARAVVGRLDPAPVSMVEDPEGGLWAIDGSGQLGRLVVARPPGQFPVALADSGCFEGPGAGSPAPDLVPYELNAPLWTDGSHKQRHIVLPPGTHIGFEEDGSLAFPKGALILKTFSYALDPAAPEVATPVETRVMIRRDYGWEFHSFAWDEEGIDARLLDQGESHAMLTMHDGAPTVIKHTFPSRDECGYCHGTGDVRALGPRIEQLARDVDYAGVQASQLDALVDIDVFDGPLPELAPMTDYRDPQALPEARARAYLHGNCGHCHRPGGWTPPDLDMDLRWTTPTFETRLCGVTPQYSSTFSADHRIAAGDPSDSLVWLRLSSRGPWQMPPVATSIPDPAAVVVREWIEGLDACPEE